jgi:hypothetical protein
MKAKVIIVPNDSIPVLPVPPCFCFNGLTYNHWVANKIRRIHNFNIRKIEIMHFDSGSCPYDSNCFSITSDSNIPAFAMASIDSGAWNNATKNRQLSVTNCCITPKLNEVQ